MQVEKLIQEIDEQLAVKREEIKGLDAEIEQLEDSIDRGRRKPLSMADRFRGFYGWN